jgi:hypothetical protein
MSDLWAWLIIAAVSLVVLEIDTRVNNRRGDDG